MLLPLHLFLRKWIRKSLRNARFRSLFVTLVCCIYLYDALLNLANRPAQQKRTFFNTDFKRSIDDKGYERDLLFLATYLLPATIQIIYLLVAIITILAFRAELKLMRKIRKKTITDRSILHLADLIRGIRSMKKGGRNGTLVSRRLATEEVKELLCDFPATCDWNHHQSCLKALKIFCAGVMCLCGFILDVLSFFPISADVLRIVDFICLLLVVENMYISLSNFLIILCDPFSVKRLDLAITLVIDLLVVDLPFTLWNDLVLFVHYHLLRAHPLPTASVSSEAPASADDKQLITRVLSGLPRPEIVVKVLSATSKDALKIYLYNCMVLLRAVLIKTIEDLTHLHTPKERINDGGLIIDGNGTAAKLAAFAEKRRGWAKQPIHEGPAVADLTFFKMSELDRSQDNNTNNNEHTVRWCGAEFFLKSFQEGERELFEHEASIQTRLDHPNVMPVVALFKDEGEHNHGILMEPMDADLEKYQERQPSTLGWPEKLSLFMAPVADGLEYMHRRGVIHRDIKPKNVLVRRNPMHTADASEFQKQQLEVKICDFGESKATSLTNTEKRGTGFYRAPDVFNVGKGGCSYNWSIDVYSYAMTFYQVMVEKEPFYDQLNQDGYSYQTLLRRVIKGKRPDLASVDDAVCPPYLKHCLRTWWARNPNTRPSFTHISCVLRHLCVLLDRCPTGVDPMKQYPFLSWPFWRWKIAQDFVKKDFKRPGRVDQIYAGADAGLCSGETARVNGIIHDRVDLVERAIKTAADVNKAEACIRDRPDGTTLAVKQLTRRTRRSNGKTYQDLKEGSSKSDL